MPVCGLDGFQPMTETEIDFDDETFMSNLEQAVRTHSDDSVNALSKSEKVYYLCAALGVETPEGHPSEHNGNVTRDTLGRVVEAVAEARREDTDESEGDE